MVDSCMKCDQCLEAWEVLCRRAATQTYNSPDCHDGTITKGGYTDHIVVRDEFVLQGSRQPGHQPRRAAAVRRDHHLLAAQKYDVGPGQKVGVAGLGGLGHMGVKLADAMGAHVTMITTSPGKGDDARALGADDVLISKDTDAMNAAAGDASTSSSTPFRSAMTSTPISTCSAPNGKW